MWSKLCLLHEPFHRKSVHILQITIQISHRIHQYYNENKIPCTVITYYPSKFCKVKNNPQYKKPKNPKWVTPVLISLITELKSTKVSQLPMVCCLNSLYQSKVREMQAINRDLKGQVYWLRTLEMKGNYEFQSHYIHCIISNMNLIFLSGCAKLACL